MPTDVHPAFKQLIENHREFFSEQLDRTLVTSHGIDSSDANPVRVPYPIRFHYAETVHGSLMKWQVMVSCN